MWICLELFICLANILSVLHRKIFHNFNYYIFFFNVIMGVMSCVMRLIRSSVVALMLVSRIERTIMPEGFKKLDASMNILFSLNLLLSSCYKMNDMISSFSLFPSKSALCRVPHLQRWCVSEFFASRLSVCNIFAFCVLSFVTLSPELLLFTTMNTHLHLHPASSTIFSMLFIFFIYFLTLIWSQATGRGWAC